MMLEIWSVAVERKKRERKKERKMEIFFQIIRILYLKINFIFHIFFLEKNEIILHY